MRLYMRQKVFSWRDRFTITDEMGYPRYFVQGELFSLGKRLHIYDAPGNEIAMVRQKLLTFLPRFYIEIGGYQVAEICKRFTLLKPRYEVDSFGWVVEGSFFEHDYSIYQGGQQVAYIHKVWMSWGDSFEIDILDPANELAAIATVLAIDCVMDQSNSGAAYHSGSQ